MPRGAIATSTMAAYSHSTSSCACRMVRWSGIWAFSHVEGRIPSRRVGTHRRAYVRDVLAYGARRPRRLRADVQGTLQVGNPLKRWFQFCATLRSTSLSPAVDDQISFSRRALATAPVLVVTCSVSYKRCMCVDTVVTLMLRASAISFFTKPSAIRRRMSRWRAVKA